MNAGENVGKCNYIIVGIGDPGKYVIENIPALIGANALLSFQWYKNISEFRVDDVFLPEQAKALFLVLQPGDSSGDEFIPGLESFISKTGIPLFTVANYPFLWEGRVRINRADNLLHDLIRISNAVFRIESHQWFPLKAQLGFHKVVELVHRVAANVVLSVLELKAQELDIGAMESIAIDDKVEAIKREDGYWTVKRIDLDV